MPLAFPSSPTNSQQYTDPNGLVWRYNGFAWEPYLGSFTRTFLGAKLSISSTINLTTTETIIPLLSQEFDVGDIFENNRFTVRETGYYRINGNFFSGNNGSGNSYSIAIKKNGTTNIESTTFGANQSAVFDSVVFLARGEYIEFYASESTASGTLTTDTGVGFYFVGSSPGTTTFSNANLFSGVKVELDTAKNLTNSNTAIPWDATEFNINADSTGNVYWTAGQSANVKIYTSGYYRVQFLVQAGSGGSNDGYTINLKKNATTIESGILSPNDRTDYDTVLYLTNGDTLCVEAAESGSAGTITTDSFLSVSRAGV